MLSAIWAVADLVWVGVSIGVMSAGTTIDVKLAAFFMVVTGICIWLLLIRLARGGLDLDSRGVTVRNLLRTERASWLEISHFAWGQRTTRAGGPTVVADRVHILCQSGRDIMVQGLLVTKSEESRRNMNELIYRLNDRLQLTHAGAGGTDLG